MKMCIRDRNISDIFAMNGTPRQLTVSIALSKRFKVEDMDDFYSLSLIHI